MKLKKVIYWGMIVALIGCIAGIVSNVIATYC